METSCDKHMQHELPRGAVHLVHMLGPEELAGTCFWMAALMTSDRPRSPAVRVNVLPPEDAVVVAILAARFWNEAPNPPGHFSAGVHVPSTTTKAWRLLVSRVWRQHKQACLWVRHAYALWDGWVDVCEWQHQLLTAAHNMNWNIYICCSSNFRTLQLRLRRWALGLLVNFTLQTMTGLRQALKGAVSAQNVRNGTHFWFRCQERLVF